MEFAAEWIGVITDERIGRGRRDMAEGSPAAYMRKEFEIDGKISRATLYITARGIYEGYINGQRVSDFLFEPQWTDYSKRIEYRKYDATELLKEGGNCVGAIVGDGWYCGKISIVGRQLYGEYPLLLLLRLTIEYEDGRTQTIVSDESFTGGSGSVRRNDLQDGQTVDARECGTEFSRYGFKSDKFVPVTVCRPKETSVSESFAPPIVYHEKLKTVFLHRDGDGKYLYDCGQNLAGNISCKIAAKAGDKIVFRYGEMLEKDGRLYTENLRTAKATDVFISDGAERVFFPSFTFHGFRYIEITKPESAEISELTVCALYSDISETGAFSSDNPLVDQIYKNAFWGQKSNFVGLPTDCPQRDERMGWTGDSFAFCGSAMFNMDCRAFYRKYMRDLADAQREDGAVPDVVPYVPIVEYGNNGWGDVVTELPYTYYLMYGDKGFLSECLPCMKKWVDYQLRNSENYLRPFGGFGDWLSIRVNETDVEGMNTAMFAHSAYLTAKACEVLGDEQDGYYRELFHKIKNAYRAKFVDKNRRVGNGNQGDYLLAYAFRLMDKEEIRDGFLRSISENDDHLSCGFMSIKYLLPALCDMGRADLAYKIISTDTYPSWGYSVKQGATTVWERWNSYTAENGFGDAAMNSFNHYSLGSCVEWYYRYVLGINYAEEGPGFSAIRVKPYFDFEGRVNKVSGGYRSVRGKIEAKWRTEKGKAFYEIKYPEDCRLLTDFSDYKIVRISQEKGFLKAELKR